jgi:DNA-binding response OmpR family regulator
MRILILEDDARIADFVSNELKQAGYAVDVLGDGEVGLHFGLNNVYDAAVIDIMLLGVRRT